MHKTRIGPTDPRMLPIEPSGLTHSHLDPGADHANPRSYHSKPPLSPSASHDPLPSRITQSHQYRLEYGDRFASEAPPLSLPRYHQERPYDRNELSSNGMHDRAQYRQERSARRPAPPPHASQPSASADPHPRHVNDQDRYYSRQPPAQPYQHQSYSTQSLYPRPDSRDDGRAGSHLRSGLSSPQDFDRTSVRMRSSNDLGHRTTNPHWNANDTTSSASNAFQSGSAAYDRRLFEPLDSARLPPFDSSSFGGASSSSSRPVQATRKRKKQFKYLLDQDEADPGRSSNVNSAEQGQDTNSPEHQYVAEGSSSVHQQKESRKKVKKACVFCKRSHMPCEEARPCKRCVKRGISHLCKDAEPVNSAASASTSSSSDRARKSQIEPVRDKALAKRRTEATEAESGSEPESMPSSVASSSRMRFGSEASWPSLPTEPRKAWDMNAMPGASARDPRHRSILPISLLMSPTNVEFQPRSGSISQEEQEEAWNRAMDPSTQHKMKQMLELGPDAIDLSDIFAEMPVSLLMTPEMASLPASQPILRPRSAGPTIPNRQDEPADRNARFQRSRSVTDNPDTEEVDEAGFKLPSRPRHILQEEAATAVELRGGLPSYSYTYGYAKLARWMHTRFTRASCEAVDRSTRIIRSRLMAISRSLSEAELIAVEDSFYDMLDYYRTHVLEPIMVPMVIVRRTGEIYAANSAMCALTQLPPSIFEGGQISVFQLVCEQDNVRLGDYYARKPGGTGKIPPAHTITLEIDRSLLLFNKPGFDPHTGKLLGDGSGLCEDGTPVVVRQKVMTTIKAQFKHGLPFIQTHLLAPILDDSSQ